MENNNRIPVLTQDMKDVFDKSRPYILGTASKDGIPNAVPMGEVKLISDNEIVITDNFMYKTRKNLEENPVATLSFWDKYGYQLKGPVRIETEGDLINEMIEMMKNHGYNFVPKALVIITVQEAYYIGASKDSSINLL